jgi:hypothetical protein
MHPCDKPKNYLEHVDTHWHQREGAYCDFEAVHTEQQGTDLALAVHHLLSSSVRDEIHPSIAGIRRSADSLVC